MYNLGLSLAAAFQEEESSETYSTGISQEVILSGTLVRIQPRERSVCHAFFTCGSAAVERTDMQNLIHDFLQKIALSGLGNLGASKHPTGRIAILIKMTEVVLIFLGLAGPGGVPLCAQSSAGIPMYHDPTQPIERRVDDLMSRMTLKEKVGQLNLPCVCVDELGKTIPEKKIGCKKFAAGTYTSEIGPACGFFTLADAIIILAFEKALGAHLRVSKHGTAG
jgi:hypothetical protein